MKHITAYLLAGLLICLPGTVARAESHPAQSQQEAAYAAELRRDTAAVFAGEDFHRMEESTRLVPRPWLESWWKNREERKQEAPPESGRFALAAMILKYAVIAALCILLAWLLYAGYRWLAPRIDSAKRKPAQTVLHAVETSALPGNTLPEQISDSAARAWQAGDSALALSLLYRGAVRSLARRYQLSLPVSATEGECLRLARASGQAVIPQAFTPIVQAWMAEAYARRHPGNFDQLLTLYRQHFEAPSGEPTP